MWIIKSLCRKVEKLLSPILELLTEALIALSVAVLIAVFSTKYPAEENNRGSKKRKINNMWQALLKFLGFRAQARMAGADTKDANKVAAAAVALEELQKKADAEAAKEKK